MARWALTLKSSHQWRLSSRRTGRVSEFRWLFNRVSVTPTPTATGAPVTLPLNFKKYSYFSNHFYFSLSLFPVPGSEKLEVFTVLFIISFCISFVLLSQVCDFFHPDGFHLVVGHHQNRIALMAVRGDLLQLHRDCHRVLLSHELCLVELEQRKREAEDNLCSLTEEHIPDPIGRLRERWS